MSSIRQNTSFGGKIWELSDKHINLIFLSKYLKGQLPIFIVRDEGLKG